MSRTSPPSRLPVLAVLLIGVALGIAAGRWAPPEEPPMAAVGLESGPIHRVAKPVATAGSNSALPRGAPMKAGDQGALYEELARQYERFEQVNRTFELVSKAVAPSVVHIVARKASRQGDGRLLRFEETGSGVIVRSDKERPDTAYVLTNHHVIEGTPSVELEIHLHDGRVVRPDRVWNDPKADIAVLRLPVLDLPAARLGDSDREAVGTWVLALGSPFGLTHSVSQGIISARNRHEDELQQDGVDNQDFLQTDAAINPGNSGGPLVNLKGEVIGINTAIASNGGGSEGVGFSIPINLARWIMDQLISQGRVRRGAMGVGLADLTASRASALGLERPRGAQVSSVQPATPAAQSDLRKGDVILRFQGEDVSNLNHLINLVTMAPIGSAVDVIIWRDGHELIKAVTVADLERIAARPEAPSGEVARGGRPTPSRAVQVPALAGLELFGVDGTNARKFGLPDKTWGVGVLDIDPSSPLAAQLQPMDVIYAAGKVAVRSVDDLNKALATRPAGRGQLELWVQRQKASAGGMHLFRVWVP